MWLGAHYFSSGMSGTRLSRSRLSTFLHELVHTQDQTDGRAHYFTVGNRNYRYGSDGDHYNTELVPNLAMTYKEGISNAIRLLYDAAAENRYFRIFSINDFLWVEKNEPPAGSNISPDAWLYTRLTRMGIAEDTVPAALRTRLASDLLTNYAAYRFHRLPPEFLVHNEYVLAVIISKYLQHVTYERFFSAITQVNQALFQASGSGVAVLYEALCTSGLPVGVTASDISSASYPGRKTYFLPLAYADYFTGYRTTTKDQFKALFENALPNNWIDGYWDGARETVRAAVPSYTTGGRAPQQGDFTSIATALGITSSQADN